MAGGARISSHALWRVGRRADRPFSARRGSERIGNCHHFLWLAAGLLVLAQAGRAEGLFTRIVNRPNDGKTEYAVYLISNLP